MIEQSQPEFTDCVGQVRKRFYEVLATPRDQLTPIQADGRGGHPLSAAEEAPK
jgi:hypothetical protein